MMKVNSNALKNLIIAKKLSLAEMARLTGLSQITCASILKDGESRRFKTVGSICHGLNIKPEEIIVND